MTDLPRNRLRRRLVVAGGAGIAAAVGLGAFSRAAQAQRTSVDLPVVNGHRNLVAYPEKRPLIVITSRPPQLETPIDVFNEGLITPNDAFFVRYHNAGIPTSIDGDKHVIKIGGNAAGKPFQLTVAELRSQFKPVELVAVNQCSGNSRALFNPRVTGGQLTNGAMGNARWVGVPLKDVLARAEIMNSAKQVTFDGLDMALMGGGDFVKALDVGQAMNGEVMLAYQMNGADLPMLNGYPVRLVVPGYYGTYWVKHLSEIQVVEQEFDGFWMKPAYRIPDNPCACVEPGTAPAATRPIGRVNVRAFITSIGGGARVRRPAARCRARHRVRRRPGHSRGRLQRRRRPELARGRARPGAEPLLVSRVHLRLHAASRRLRLASARLQSIGREPADGGLVATVGLHAQRRRVGQGPGELEDANMKHTTLSSPACWSSWPRRSAPRTSSCRPTPCSSRPAPCRATPRRRPAARCATPPSTCATSRRARRARTGTRWCIA